MTRTQLWLAVALAAQLALIALLRASGDGAGDGAARPLLPALDGLAPQRIELIDEDGERLELARGATGWTIPAADGFPADTTKIDALIDDLRGLTVRRPVVRSSRYHDTFQLADDGFVGRLRIWGDGDGDAPAVDLLLGSASNYRTTHARRADADEVYEVAGLAPFDLRPKREAWVRKRLIDAEPSDVAGLRVRNELGTLALADGEAGWALDGDAAASDGLVVDTTVVDALLRAATGLRIADSAGPVDDDLHGLATPQAEVVLQLVDGGEVRLRLGAAVDGGDGGDGKRYATVDGFGFAVTVWDSSVRPLLDASRDAALRPADAAETP